MLCGIAEKHGHDLIPTSSKQEIHEALANKKTPVWLPSKCLENNKEIPQNWSVTSDSLSAWLAKELKAEKLILIKRIGIDVDSTFAELTKENIVDSSFKSFVRGSSFDIRYLTAGQQTCMQEILKVVMNVD